MFIVDSSVIISFYREIGVPDVLNEFHRTGYLIIVPSRVYGEIKGTPFNILTSAIESGSIRLCSIMDAESCNEFKFRHPALSNGEIEVILLGLRFRSEGKRYWCVLDDKKARKVAEVLEITVIGTIGLLDFMEECRHISDEQKRAFIEILKSSSFRL
jgi:predicted nucleic acid-binding protein